MSRPDIRPKICDALKAIRDGAPERFAPWVRGRVRLTPLDGAVGGGVLFSMSGQFGVGTLVMKDGLRIVEAQLSNGRRIASVHVRDRHVLSRAALT